MTTSSAPRSHPFLLQIPLQIVCCSEQGSALVMIMIFIMAIGGLMTYSSIHFASQMKAQAYLNHRAEAADLATMVQMSYTSPDSCAANLSSSGIGSKLSELYRGDSDKTSRTLLYSTTPGGQPNVLLTPGTHYGHEVVSLIQFGRPVLVNGLTNVYLSELHVTSSPDATSVASTSKLPFYIITDASGAMTGCYATSVITNANGATVTMDDSICNQLSGSKVTAGGQLGLNKVYDPSQKACTNVTLTTSTLPSTTTAAN